MKFSTLILSVALVLSASSHAHAFSTLRSTSSLAGNAVRSTSLAPLASTTEDKVETASALSPEFQVVLDAATAKLTSSLPTKDPKLAEPLVHFMSEYFRALSAASDSGATNPDGSSITPAQAAEIYLTTLKYCTKYGLGAGPGGKFAFEDVRHRALLGSADDPRYAEPTLAAMLGDDAGVDFYAAGCDFFRPSIDLARSAVLGAENMEKALAQIDAGENVVFLANHQSEADPQVVSCLFETVSEGCGGLAARVTYVAGHKVTTDALAVPFSMGRNLLCIHSKKHIDADPETKPGKSRQNMAAMNSMLAGLREGGMAIWVAPSGGRDRRDVESGTIPIAPFDQKTVDMFRLMGNKSRVPTHFYAMSMASYDLCPPPDFVEAGVGETRNVRFTPVGICVGDEVPNVGGAEKRHLFTERAQEECDKGYLQLLKEMGMERYIP